MDTGRVIARRYLLQRLMQRGAACVIYQGFDQVLQRPVAIKVAPSEHISMYRTALRATSQFSHPNIIGIYDLLIEPDALYIIQEYVDGDDLGIVQQTQLSPYDVADLGLQVCQALMYAGTSSRKVCHGDLTPASVLRDRRGSVRVNNFALPSDVQYFTSWSGVGGNGVALSSPELPYGQMNDARKSDDVRAVGLLLYQLLSGRAPGASTAEPPADGVLRFLPAIPRELCDIVARAIIRNHPQHILTAEALHAELKAVAITLEPAQQPAQHSQYEAEEPARFAQQQQPFAPAPAAMAPAATLSAREHTTSEDDLLPRRSTSARLADPEPAPPAPRVSDMSMKLAAARHAAYGTLPETVNTPQRVNFPLVLLFCLILFGLFFGLGYWLAQIIIR